MIPLIDGIEIHHQDGKTYRPTPGNCRFGDHTQPMLPCALDEGRFTCGVRTFCAAGDRPDGKSVVWRQNGIFDASPEASVVSLARKAHAAWLAHNANKLAPDLSNHYEARQLSTEFAHAMLALGLALEGK